MGGRGAGGGGKGGGGGAAGGSLQAGFLQNEISTLDKEVSRRKLTMLTASSGGKVAARREYNKAFTKLSKLRYKFYNLTGKDAKSVNT